MPKLTIEEIDNRYTYHAPKEGQQVKYDVLRCTARGFAWLINDVCPDCRETALALTNLEQATFWANAAIARRSE